jgi:hypothetical protein
MLRTVLKSLLNVSTRLKPHLQVGEYTEEELQPDADLGKAIRPGFRNMAPAERVFGLPSVRVDIARRYPQPSTTQVSVKSSA